MPVRSVCCHCLASAVADRGRFLHTALVTPVHERCRVGVQDRGPGGVQSDKVVGLQTCQHACVCVCRRWVGGVWCVSWSARHLLTRLSHGLCVHSGICL